MGCDIHCYIESAYPPRDGPLYWESFGGRINPGRCYPMFESLARVRSHGRDGMCPRGIPADLARTALSDYAPWVVDDEPEGDEVTRDTAERWVSGGGEWWSSDKSRVVSPDWHNATYMTPAEWRERIAAAVGWHEGWEPDAEYFAIAAACEELERRGRVVRIVMWFDN